LTAVGQINNAQTSAAQPDTVVDLRAPIIGAPMDNGLQHLIDFRRIHTRRTVFTTNTAHFFR
jgi:hypothetical protein